MIIVEVEKRIIKVKNRISTSAMRYERGDDIVYREQDTHDIQTLD